MVSNLATNRGVAGVRLHAHPSHPTLDPRLWPRVHPMTKHGTFFLQESVRMVKKVSSLALFYFLVVVFLLVLGPARQT